MRAIPFVVVVRNRIPKERALDETHTETSSRDRRRTGSPHYEESRITPGTGPGQRPACGECAQDSQTEPQFCSSKNISAGSSKKIPGNSRTGSGGNRPRGTTRGTGHGTPLVAVRVGLVHRHPTAADARSVQSPDRLVGVIQAGHSNKGASLGLARGAVGQHMNGRHPSILFKSRAAFAFRRLKGKIPNENACHVFLIPCRHWPQTCLFRPHFRQTMHKACRLERRPGRGILFPPPCASGTAFCGIPTAWCVRKARHTERGRCWNDGCQPSFARHGKPFSEYDLLLIHSR